MVQGGQRGLPQDSRLQPKPLPDASLAPAWPLPQLCVSSQGSGSKGHRDCALSSQPTAKGGEETWLRQRLSQGAEAPHP